MSDIEALASRIILIGKGRLLHDGSLQGLRSQFGTRKTITADYRTCHRPLVIPGASMLSWSPERAQFSIDTGETVVSEVLAVLSSQVELVDVTIDAQPIDDMIVQLYKEYQLS